MKIDISKPKKWQQFVNDLGVEGADRVLLQNCRPDIWKFPMIILTVDANHSPVVTKARVKCLRDMIAEYYESPDINLNIFTRAEGEDISNFDEVINQLKEDKQVSIIDIIRCKIDLKEISVGRYVGLCPFHEERTPSFTVHEKEQTYHCFGCGASGNYKDFIKAYQEAKYIEEFNTGQFYASPKLLDAVLKKDKEIAKADEELKKTLMKIIESIADNNIARITNAKLKQEIIESIKECQDTLP